MCNDFERIDASYGEGGEVQVYGCEIFGWVAGDNYENVVTYDDLGVDSGDKSAY